MKEFYQNNLICTCSIQETLKKWSHSLALSD